MKIKLLVLSALLFSGLCFAKIELPNQIEIEQAVDTLVDTTDPISEKELKASVKHIKKGIKSHDKRKFKKAIKAYNKALEKNPLSATAHYELGLSLTAENDIRLAYEHTLKALALEPGMEEAHILKASLLDDAGYVDESIAAWLKLIDINPNSYMAWLNKGITHLKIEQFEPAEEAFTKAVEIEPKHPSGHYFMFVMNGMRGYTYEEEKHLKNYLDVSKGDHRKQEAEQRLAQINNFYKTINIDPNTSSMKLNLMQQLVRVRWKSEKHREAYPEEKFYRPSLAEEEEVLQFSLSVLGEIDEKNEEKVEADIKILESLKAIQQAGFVKEKAFVELKEVLGKKDLEWGAQNQSRIKEYMAWAELQKK